MVSTAPLFYSLGSGGVITSLDEWVSFLQSSHRVAGFPLIVGGLGLMLFGWRMWRLCVILSFALIGAIIGHYVAGPRNDQTFYSLVGAVVLGLVAYFPAVYALSLLGGSIAAVISFYYLTALGMDGVTLWALVVAVLGAGTATAWLNRRHVVIVVTAFLGAVLLISGLASWAMAMPAFFSTVRTMSAGSFIVVPFLLLVPTVMSCFYQVAEVRRLHIQL